MSQQQEMLRYINIARQFPTYFISIIDHQIASFLNQKQMPIGEDILYQTNQGKKAWLEAKAFLQQQKSLPKFQEHEGLDLSATDHAKDLSLNGIFGHTGSDYSTFSQRILKHCRKGHGSMAQIIGADFMLKDRNHAEMTILGLIIDDGVTDRGHRKTIFSHVYKFIGCKSQIQNDKIVTVFNLTQNRLNLRSKSSMQYTGNSFISKQSKIQFEQANQRPQLKQKQHYNQNAFKQSKGFNNDLKSTGEKVFGQISNPVLGKSNISNFKTSESKARNNPSKNRKLCQKRESSRIFYEDSSKITQTTTTFIYNDGTTEENVNRQTVYLDEQ